MPNIIDLFLLSMIGILGGLANLWLSQSYKYSEVSLVTPLKYLALVFAIFFGYFIWQEVPTIKTLIGASLVIISSFIIFRSLVFFVVSENRLGKGKGKIKIGQKWSKIGQK